MNAAATATKSRPHDPVATQAAILDAAEQLFAAKGFAATSMRGLANLSQTSKALIHHHFGSKEALYIAAKRRAVERYHEVQRPQHNLVDDPAKFLVQTTRALFHFCRENRTLVRLGVWGHLEGDKTPWPTDDEVRPLIMEQIRKAQQQGILRDDLHPELLEAALVAMVFHWWQFKQVHAERFADYPRPDALDEDYLEQILKILAYGAAGPALQNTSAGAAAAISEHDLPTSQDE